MKVLIACSMIEDELNEIIRRHNLSDEMKVLWMERGHHEYPERLNEVVSDEIRKAEDMGADEILLAYGLCGNGAIGWKSDNARLVIPRFDDCVNMMLCPKARTERNLLETGKMYLTRGWTAEKGSLKTMLDEAKERYGDKRGIKAIKLMLGAYHHLTILDTGCYDLGPVKAYADECATQLDLNVEIRSGSIRPMEKLLTGQWDDDIIVKEPGEAVELSDFEILI